MSEISLLGAFVAGLLSFLSPCVLPLVPAYLSFISGVSVDVLRGEGEIDQGKVRRKAMIQSLWFVLGFSLIFIALGASATWFGQWLLLHMASLAKVAGIVIVVFGLHYTGLIRIPFLMVDTRLNAANVKSTSGLGALLLGSAFAFGWTPCIGPILGAILAMAGMQGQVGEGMMLLVMYSVGLGVPFLIAAYATNAFLNWSQRFKRHLHTVEILSGVLLMIVGLMIFLGSFSVVSGYLIAWLPWLADIEGMVNF